jgi:hypothetical protein
MSTSAAWIHAAEYVEVAASPESVRWVRLPSASAEEVDLD